MTSSPAYEDEQVRCDGEGIVIKRYYPWGSKKIRYDAIASVERVALSGFNALRKWRIWGSGDFTHWWNLDTQRPHKEVALVLHVGRHVLPTITPDDPTAVTRLIESHSSRP